MPSLNILDREPLHCLPLERLPSAIDVYKRQLINGAERPLVLVGQGVELGEAQQELRAFIEQAGMPEI